MVNEEHYRFVNRLYNEVAFSEPVTSNHQLVTGNQ